MFPREFQELWPLSLWRKVQLVADNDSSNGGEVQENRLHSKEGNAHSFCEKEEGISGYWQGIHTPAQFYNIELQAPVQGVKEEWYYNSIIIIYFPTLKEQVILKRKVLLWFSC